jgi:hypothetical protein
MEKFVLFDDIFNNQDEFTVYKDGKIILQVILKGNVDLWVPVWAVPIKLKNQLTFRKKR